MLVDGRSYPPTLALTLTLTLSLAPTLTLILIRCTTR